MNAECIPHASSGSPRHTPSVPRPMNSTSELLVRLSRVGTDLWTRSRLMQRSRLTFQGKTCTSLHCTSQRCSDLKLSSFKTHSRDNLSDDALKLVEFAGEVIKGSGTIAAFIFGDKTKRYNVTLTRGRVGAQGRVNGQVAIRVMNGPMFPILKAEVTRDC